MRNRGREKSNAGFTLIEMIITIVLVSVIAGIAAVIILQGVTSYTVEDQRSDVRYQTTLAVERIAREVRMIRDCSDLTIPSNPAASFSFTDRNGASATFSVSGGDLFRGGNLLASGITSATPFTFIASDGATPTTACPGVWFIDIDITGAQGTQSLRIKRRVRPRNFS